MERVAIIKRAYESTDILDRDRRRAVPGVVAANNFADKGVKATLSGDQLWPIHRVAKGVQQEFHTQHRGGCHGRDMRTVTGIDEREVLLGTGREWKQPFQLGNRPINVICIDLREEAQRERPT